MTLSPTKAACYVRVSTENQLENYSIAEQTKRLTAYCAAKDWQIVKIYTDGGFSGGNLNRPALQQLRQDILQGGIDIVVVYKLDRLSRSQKDTLTLIENDFLQHHVDFVSVNENFDTATPFGRAMIGMLSVFAQLEKDQITERFTMGRIGRSQAGYYHGGAYAPTGYQYQNGLLILDEYQAQQIKEIYQRFLSGQSIHAIRQAMSQQYGGWKHSASIYQILQNNVYTGKIKFQGKSYPGKHTPIISESQFQEVQKLLHSKSRARQKTAPQKTPFRAGYLLSSLLYCSQCGAKYSANHGYYKCYSRSKCNRALVKDPHCQNRHWPIPQLDQIILQAFGQFLAQTQNLTDLLEKIAQPDQTPLITAAPMIDLATQKERIITLYQGGSLSLSETKQRLQALKKTEQHIQNQQQTPLTSTNIPSLIVQQGKLLQLIQQAPIAQQRLLLSSIISAIFLDGPKITIHWRFSPI